MKKLIDGVMRFQQSYFRYNEDLFSQLQYGQRPETLFLTCSDSRICPNQLTQTGPGDLFILRNAGNFIAPYDPEHPTSEGMSLEYGVLALKIPSIVICGHSHCGAMQGVLNQGNIKELPLVSKKLQSLEHYLPALQGREVRKEDELVELIRINVVEQLKNLLTYPFILKAWQKQELEIAGWVYHFEKGQVEQFNFLTQKFSWLN